MDSEDLVREIVRQARDLPFGRDAGGWVQVSIPEAAPAEMAAAIREAQRRGLIIACDVSSGDLPYEWWVLQITPAGENLLHAPARRRAVSALIWCGAAVLLLCLAWLELDHLPQLFH
jgi:hypothetical protein